MDDDRQFDVYPVADDQRIPDRQTVPEPTCSGGDVDLEELTLRCLEALENEGATAVHAILADHPERAEEVHRLLGSLDEIGLVDGKDEEWRPPVQRVGGFELLRRLGEGGMGVVYLARQESVNRLVALKLLRPGTGAGAAGVARFEREAQAIARLRHPNIVIVHEAGEDQCLRYIAMELITGNSLDELVKQARQNDRPLDPRQVTAWARDIARALDSAHRADIVHRDVKPSNIRIADDGRAVLLDFGLAREASAKSLTLSGSFQGSPHFASPEQVTAARRKIGPPTDVYSLGVTIYSCLSGVLPFDGNTTEQIFHQILAVEPIALGRLDARVSRDLETVVHKAMEKDPSLRYPSAAAFADDLDALIDDRTILARPPGTIARIGKWARRHPVGALGVASVLTLLIVLAVGLGVSLDLLAQTRRAEQDRALTMAVLDLRALPREVDALWPSVPERVRGPRGMDAWLSRARALEAALPDYRRKLAALRVEITPNAALEAGRRRIFEQIAELETAPLATGEPGDNAEKHLTQARAERIAELRRELSWQLQPDFADPAHAEKFAALEELVIGIPKLEGLIGIVEARRDFATTVGENTIDSYRLEWTEVIAEIRQDARYHELVLEPQLGLVPLGRDPDSELFEFAHAESGTIPMRDDEGRLQLEDDFCMVFVLLPGGRLRMGATRPSEELPNGPNVDRWANEKHESPVHHVTLEPMFISKFEMTQSQWLRVTGESPSGYGAGTEIAGESITSRHPVEQISWLDARRWMARLGLRLPTEAQWEYAARAGTTTVWWTGDEKQSLTRAANISDETVARDRNNNWPYESSLNDGYSLHAPVGIYRANAFGLHDVAGNVYEWCRDWYRSYDVEARPGDGLREGFQAAFRMARSGPFNDLARSSRSSNRSRFAPTFKYFALGVRPIRDIDR